MTTFGKFILQKRNPALLAVQAKILKEAKECSKTVTLLNF